MHKGQIFAKDFPEEWVEYPFIAMTANAIAQCEWTLRDSCRREENRGESEDFIGSG